MGWLRGHDDRPFAPLVSQVPVHLTRTGVFEEVVQGLFAVSQLEGSTSPGDRAETGRTHTRPGRRARHTLGQQDLGPDLQALGPAGNLARLEGVDGPAANQDCAELGGLGRRDRARGSSGHVRHSDRG
jgi:hypothetical protein